MSFYGVIFLSDCLAILWKFDGILNKRFMEILSIALIEKIRVL